MLDQQYTYGDEVVELSSLMVDGGTLFLQMRYCRTPISQKFDTTVGDQ